jgi:hypothetical protein
VNREASRITRRSFALALGAAGTPGQLESQTPRTALLGEPVRILGNRLVFNGWHWVRPGGFAWVSPKQPGGGLEADVAPGEAQIRRTDVPWGVELVTHPAERVGPLLRPEAPWEEGVGVKFTTVRKDQGMYRAWGMPTDTSGRPKGQRFFCYYESHDGYAWKRPVVGICPFEGSMANNILNRSTHDYTKADKSTPMEFRKPEVYSGTVFLDPSAGAAERYKLIALGNIGKETFDRYRRQRPGAFDAREEDDFDEKDGAKAVRGGVSPDGIHWQFLPDPLVVEPSDTHLVACFDPNLRRYVAYTRKRTGMRRAEGRSAREQRTTDPLRRCVGRSETGDFRAFPVSEVVLELAPHHPPAAELYTNCRTALPGAPDHHLMFPALWSNWDDTTRFPVAVSPDGVRWNWLPGDPVFGPGPPGEWDAGAIFTFPEMTELGDGSWVLPYVGYNVPHKYPRGQWRFMPGYARWPGGRVVGIRADREGGFATIGLIPPGRELRINVRGGSVRVEAAGLDGLPLPGRSFADCSEVRGDHRGAVVGWRGGSGLNHRVDQAVLLRFQLRQATVFWVEFA